MSSSSFFFYGDLVFKPSEGAGVGMVLKNPESQIGGEEEDSFYRAKPIKEGHVRVAWHPCGEEVDMDQSQLKLINRFLAPGDVVTRLDGEGLRQFGLCQSVEVAADLHVIGTHQVLTGVDTADLEPLQVYEGATIFLDPWIGRVKSVKKELLLKCSDGSRCVMPGEIAAKMEDILDERDLDCAYSQDSEFYRGQKLRGPLRRFKTIKWLELTKQLKACIDFSDEDITAIVEDVLLVSLSVLWVNSVRSKSDTDYPDEIISGEDLKRMKIMDIFRGSTIMIGDRNFVTMQENYNAINLHDWKNSMVSRFSDSPTEQEPSVKVVEEVPPFPGKRIVTEALFTQTRVTVMWQDGTLQHSIASTDLYPVFDLQDNVFFPGNCVVSIQMSSHDVFLLQVDNFQECPPHEYAVVTSVDASDQTAVTTWMKSYLPSQSKEPKILYEVELKSTDIQPHPFFRFCLGDCVCFRSSPKDGPPQESTAGEVVGLHPTGQVEVQWIGGESSLCYPQMLNRVLGYSRPSDWDEVGSDDFEDSAGDSVDFEDSEGATADFEEAGLTSYNSASMFLDSALYDDPEVDPLSQELDAASLGGDMSPQEVSGGDGER